MTGEGEGAIERSNTRCNIEIAKPPIFNKKASRVGEFIMAYRLYLRIKMRGVSVEEQI